MKVSDAQGIVQSCLACQKVGFGLGIGVNPRGLKSLQLWQMDVTHVPEFRYLKYVHVCIGTFSHVIRVTSQTGETAKHVMKHVHHAIAVLGIPQELKTDNGPAYVSTSFSKFCTLWRIRHLTGIPHLPTGQAIVERAHGTLKSLLQKQKEGELLPPSERLAKALYVLELFMFDRRKRLPSHCNSSHVIAIRNSKKKLMQLKCYIGIYERGNGKVQ